MFQKEFLSSSVQDTYFGSALMCPLLPSCLRLAKKGTLPKQNHWNIHSGNRHNYWKSHFLWGFPDIPHGFPNFWWISHWENNPADPRTPCCKDASRHTDAMSNWPGGPRAKRNLGRLEQPVSFHQNTMEISNGMNMVSNGSLYQCKIDGLQSAIYGL